MLRTLSRRLKVVAAILALQCAAPAQVPLPARQQQQQQQQQRPRPVAKVAQPRVALTSRPLPASAARQLSTVHLSAAQSAALVAGGVARHRVFQFAPPGRLASLRLSSSDGALLMPELEGARVSALRLRDLDVGAAYVGTDNFSVALAGAGGRAVGVLSLDRAGTLTLSVDPNRDRIADYVEIWAGPRRQTIFVREGLGEAFVAAMMAGKSAFCMRLPGAEADGGWLRTPDSRATLDMCGSNRGGKAGGGAVGGGGGLVRQQPEIPHDPLASACARFGSRLARPARFGGANRADHPDLDTGPLEDLVDSLTDFIPDAGVASGVGAVASAVLGEAGAKILVTAIGVIGGAPAAEFVAANAATISTATTGVGAFLAVTLTPSQTHASGCETSRHGCHYDPNDGHVLTDEEYERVRAEREAGGAGATTTPPGPAGGAAGGGTRTRPAGEADLSAFRAFCARQKDHRQEWQRVMDERRARNFADCVDPATGRANSDRSAYCRFVQSALNPKPYDILAEVAEASRAPGERGSPFTPEQRIRERIMIAQRMAGGLGVFACDPKVCQPPLN